MVRIRCVRNRPEYGGLVPSPTRIPVSLELIRATNAVNRAFASALAKAGGSLPVWLVLSSLKTQPRMSQHQLAAGMGIGDPTIAHHLRVMAGAGLITRERDPANRRVQHVRLTAAGDEMYRCLRAAAVSFDEQLCAGISPEDRTRLAHLLRRLSANAVE